ncbi:MAG: hypothetical protein ACI8VT_002627, partial [Saprospiraceae bacterium]
NEKLILVNFGLLSAKDSVNNKIRSPYYKTACV